MKMAADFKTAQPLEYYRQFLKEDVRPDGRTLMEFRKTILNVGSISTAEGSALVKLGNTTVVCGVKAEFAVPSAEKPSHGYLVPNVDLPPLCSSRFRPGPPNEQAQVLSQFVADAISNCEPIDLKDLCIAEGKLCWVLYVDIVCLSYDGNITDAALIAAVAALKNTQLYAVTVNEESQVPEPSETREISLTLKQHPVAATFGIFDDSVLFADPTDEEEALLTGIVTIVVTDDEKIGSLHKPGGSPLPDHKLQECFKKAITRGREIRDLIHTACLDIDR
ncbi:exosome complex component RRP43-like isoform X1 [Acropora muricata]|uniref:exosome complex component RRP43-like isoform X1 n=1 Tax=Acropora muricata TaxID=159855 RepID=UPI0034E47D99